MKPPTNEALRYAATVLGREVTQLERLLDHAADTPEAQARLQLHELLVHVRSVRTWILGVQMPIAQRREARAAPASIIPTRKPCTECGELMAYDHTVCFYCATGTQRAAMLATTMERCETWIHDSADEQPHGRECRCPECAAAPIQPADLKLLKTSVIGLINRPK